MPVDAQGVLTASVNNIVSSFFHLWKLQIALHLDGAALANGVESADQ